MNEQPVAHQRLIRDREAARDPTAGGLRPNGDVDQGVGDYIYVEAISLETAAEFIKRYEWLGTIGHPKAAYGLLDGFGTLIAVATFGVPAGIESRDVCGREHRDHAICLERGACAPFAAKNAGSYFIPRALALASKENGWKIFYAYADQSAGEIGTIYQACGWTYIGQGVGRQAGRARWQYRKRDWPKGKFVDERSFYRRGLSMADVGTGKPWTRRAALPKHKYVTFVGDKSEQKLLRKALRYPPLPYPKRPTKSVKPKKGSLQDNRGRPATGRDKTLTVRLSAPLLKWIDKQAGGRTAVIRKLVTDAASTVGSRRGA